MTIFVTVILFTHSIEYIELYNFRPYQVYTFVLVIGRNNSVSTVIGASLLI